MRSALHVLSRRQVAVIAFGAAALMVAACENANTSSGTSPSSIGFLPKAITYPSPAYSFVPYTIPSVDNVEITGIDNDKGGFRIVGVYYGAGSSAVKNSFTAGAVPTAAVPTPTPWCKDEGWTCPTADPPNTTGARNIYFNEISLKGNGNDFSVGFAPPFSNSSGAGYGCTKTSGSTNKYCAVVYDPKDVAHAHLYEMQDPNESGTCASTYLYGTSDPLIQVGYYNTGAIGNCKSHAFEEYIYPSGTSASKAKFVDFQLPGDWNATSSMAYGINNKGDVVGAFTRENAEIGWEYHEFCYYKIRVELLSTEYNTEALGINWQDIVVGSYWGSSGTPNGFVESNGTPYTVNEGTDGAGTVANNINVDNMIVGYHIGGGNHGYRAGFIATCKDTSSASGSGDTTTGDPCPQGPPKPLSSCTSTSSSDTIDYAIRRRP
jgi:hypothetical protein